MYEVKTVAITCVTSRCGLTMWVPKTWENARRNDHATFYCPNGHKMWFSVASDEEKLRRQNESLKQQQAMICDERDTARRSAAAYKGQTTKLRRRASAGVCPCCSRHFENLQRHMGNKHPEFT